MTPRNALFAQILSNYVESGNQTADIRGAMPALTKILPGSVPMAAAHLTRRRNLPNLIIAGVHKAGTTSLFNYLSQHPDICASRIKETRFLSAAATSGLVDLRKYESYFAHATTERYLMEASPNYLYYGQVPELIRKELTNPRIIVMLRDPAERLYSLYNRAVAHSEITITFDDYLTESLSRQPDSSRAEESYLFTRGLRDGYYIEHLRRWHAVFGNRLLILSFDDLQEDSWKCTARVLRWLGLDCNLDRQGLTVENRTLHYRNKRVHRLLVSLYARTEAFWRRHDRLRKRVRSIYNRVNAGQASFKPDLSRARGIYAPYNAELREFLRESGYNAPSWLRCRSDQHGPFGMHAETGDSYCKTCGEDLM